MDKLKDRQWEIENSSFGKRFQNATYEQCRKCACYDIVHNLTKIDFVNDCFFEIPKGILFNFLVRVDTQLVHFNEPKFYYNQFINTLSKLMVKFTRLKRCNFGTWKL